MNINHGGANFDLKIFSLGVHDFSPEVMSQFLWIFYLNCTLLFFLYPSPSFLFNSIWRLVLIFIIFWHRWISFETLNTLIEISLNISRSEEIGLHSFSEHFLHDWSSLSDMRILANAKERRLLLFRLISWHFLILLDQWALLVEEIFNVTDSYRLSVHVGNRPAILVLRFF